MSVNVYINLTKACLADSSVCQANYYEQCSVLYNGSEFFQLSEVADSDNYFQLISLLAAAFNIWFMFLVYYNKELQAHPMRLFMWIAFADALYFSNTFFPLYTCQLGIPNMVCWLVYWEKPTYVSLSKVMVTLYNSIQWIEFFGLYLSLCLNICLMIDLVLMIKFPFNSKDKRMTRYIVVSMISAVLVSSFLVHSIVENFSINGFIVFVSGYCFLIVIGIYSSTYAYKKLSKPGISSEIRSLVLKRHIIAVSLYIILNLYVFASGISCIE